MANNADYILLQFPDQMPAPIPGELETIVNSAIVNSPRVAQLIQAAVTASIQQQLQTSPDVDPRIDARIDARIPAATAVGRSPVWDGTKYVAGFASLLSRKTLTPFPSTPVNGWAFASNFPSGYFQLGENIYWIQLACSKPQNIAFTNFESVLTMPIATTAAFFGTPFENTIPRMNGSLVQAQTQGVTPTDTARWILASTFVITA